MTSYPTPFATLVTAVKASVPAELDGAKVHFIDDDPGKQVANRPPSILFGLEDDAYAEAKEAGRGPGQRSALWVAATRISFECWGNDRDQAHELRRTVIVALHAIGAGKYRIEQGSWNTGGVTKKGAAYTFIAIVEIPILRDEEADAVILAMPQSIEIDEPEVEP